MSNLSSELNKLGGSAHNVIWIHLIESKKKLQKKHINYISNWKINNNLTQR
ncbi:hypothetical protein CCP2SC5_440019 [Azospirillaceae bacterium]